jgi:AcrR family transcriptional regulator
VTAPKAARTKTTPPPVRQDAVRNRALLVDAAREVFRERGLNATLDDIAARAGVGTGTAYRHFRNKHEIAVEVLGDATQQIVRDAEAAQEIADPWLAIVAFFEAVGARQADDRGLYQALAGQGSDDDKARIWPQIVRSVTELFDRATRAKVIRADAAPEDAASMFAMLGVAFEMSHGETPDLWRRYLALMLDGLRATDRPPLPAPPPIFGSLDDVIAAGKNPSDVGRPRRR